MSRESLISKEDYVFYEDGRIYNKCKERFLKEHIHKNGYVQVGLKCVDGKFRLFYWHRVIWFAFNSEIPDGYEINHISELKTDNKLSNLECISHLANIRYGTGVERRAEKQSKPVVALDKDGNVVIEFPSTQEAGRNGFNSGAVSACCRNCYYGNNYYKGYYWYYKEDWLEMKNAVPHKRETA